MNLVFNNSHYLAAKKFRARGFSLIEVVVAVGIFAIAIVSVIGLLGPINKTVSEVREFDDASRVISAIQEKLQEAGFTNVGNFMDNDITVYASRDGNQVASSSAWVGSDADKFFAIKLIRNWTEDTTDSTKSTGLSNPANDGTAGYLAFTIKLQWPAYTPDGALFTDTTQQSVMIVPAAITR